MISWRLHSFEIDVYAFILSLCDIYLRSNSLFSNTTPALIVDMKKKNEKSSFKWTALIFYFTEYLLYQLWGRAFLESFENHSGSGSSNATQNGVESESEEEEGRPRTRGHGLRPLTRISVRTGAGRNRPMSQPQYLHG